MERKIDIAKILSPDLKSRSAVGDLVAFLRDSDDQPVVFDFADVKFATRSFVDEFHNAFLMQHVGESKTIVNVSADIQMIFDSVSHTQHKKKRSTGKNNVLEFKDFSDMRNYLLRLSI